MSGFGKVLAFALVLDHDRRRRNHDEFCERINGNIQRWEEQIRRNEEAQTRVDSNLTRNLERLSKSRLFLERMNSSATREWLERNERNAREHSKEEVRQAAATKVREHYTKLADAEQQYAKTQTWVEEGKTKLRELKNWEYDLHSKISSARSKL
ncbi:hypothetical protein V0M98_38210 (plasmid) [Pseudomonas silesiensis]|uniref:hypothetical protein n=1 Tax=Pseudomonas silesiensis TaxID=1853130 RepID=UPI0030D00E9B